jgi:uncharacterized phage-like protein YoqJ
VTFTDEELVALRAHRGLPVAFTGHRPDKLAQYEAAVRKHIFTALMVMEPSEVISGMALGLDTWAALTALKMNIPLRAAVPFDGQHLRWPEEARRRYVDILFKAKWVKVVCEGSYHPSKMQARNEWMVDHCALLLGYWNGSRGGTKNCLDYARRVNRDRLVFDPTKL